MSEAPPSRSAQPADSRRDVFGLDKNGSGIIARAMSRSLRELYESSPFSSAQAPYVEEQYERYLSDPASRQPGMA